MKVEVGFSSDQVGEVAFSLIIGGVSRGTIREVEERSRGPSSSIMSGR